MDAKNKKSEMISLTAFEERLECLRAALENAHVRAAEELEKAAMASTPEEEEEHQKKAVFFGNKIDWLSKAIDDLENGKFPLFSRPPAPTSSVVPPSVTSNLPLRRTLFQKDCAEDDPIFSTPMKPKSASFSASSLALASAFAPRQPPRNTASSSASSAPSAKNRSFPRDLPKFDPDDPKISNPLTFIRALEFHLQDDQPPERWYKALIASIVNPSAKAWALSHLDLPGTPWTSVKAIFFNHFVPQSSNFVAYEKLRYLRAGPTESVRSISEKILEMCDQIIPPPPPDFLASTLCNALNKDLRLRLASAFATNPPNDFNEAVATAIAMEANLQAIQLAHSPPPLPSTTSPPPSKPTSSTSTAEQRICYKCKQQGHLASSCPNKTNKNSSGLFALTTGYNDDDPPNEHDDDDDDDPPATAIRSGPPPGPSATLSYLQCDDVDSYYEYCRAINELVEDSLDHDPYASL
ncbi:hypothetical protein QOT17_022657 [Balamuthia mandrillaris]